MNEEALMLMYFESNISKQPLFYGTSKWSALGRNFPKMTKSLMSILGWFKTFSDRKRIFKCIWKLHK
jgi:hypothetical protein